MTFDDAPNYGSDSNGTMQKIVSALKKYDGAGTFFAPELAANNNVKAAAADLGMPIIASDIGTGDWDTAHTTAQMIKESCLNAVDGSIVLMHCWPQTTASVIEEICDELYSKGYRFVTLSQLFELNGKNISDSAGEVIKNINDAK